MGFGLVYRGEVKAFPSGRSSGVINCPYSGGGSAGSFIYSVTKLIIKPSPSEWNEGEGHVYRWISDSLHCERKNFL